MSFVSRTTGDVVAEILMSRAAFDGSFLVVEGDSDSKFFRRRVCRESCHLIIAGSKDTVFGAVLKSSLGGHVGILGAVDDDYDSVCNIPIPSPHVVRTDARDLETLMLRSPALDHVLDELADPTKLASLQAQEGVSVRDALINRALIFGKLRLLARCKGWSLDFKQQFSPWRFGAVETWSIDEAAIVSRASGLTGIPATDLQVLISQISIVDPYQVLHGKDTIEILAMGLRSKLGSHQQSSDRILQTLRLAFDDKMAAACQLFKDIRGWESANQPYRILV